MFTYTKTTVQSSVPLSDKEQEAAFKKAEANSQILKNIFEDFGKLMQKFSSAMERLFE